MTTIATRPSAPATPESAAARTRSATHRRPRTATADERRGARLAGATLLATTAVALPATILLEGTTAPGGPLLQVTVGAAFLLVAALDVVVGWGLHLVLRRRATPASTAQLVARSGYAALLAGTAAVLAWPGGAGTTGFERDWAIALVVFGLHLVIAGVALWQSKVAPRLVAAVTTLAGLAYLLDVGLARLSDSGSSAVAVPLVLGEVVLLGWLLHASRKRVDGLVHG